MVNFWKNHDGILLNCLLKDEADKALNEFHAGDCGGHLYWKSTADKVLRWDFRREDKGKHGKFDFLWKGTYIIHALQGNNTYFLKNLDNSEAEEGPVNGRMLKHYFDPIY